MKSQEKMAHFGYGLQYYLLSLNSEEIKVERRRVKWNLQVKCYLVVLSTWPLSFGFGLVIIFKLGICLIIVVKM